MSDTLSGFHHEWDEEGPDWRVATDDERALYKCRGTRGCPAPVVAALNRGRWNGFLTRRADAWWFYCADHLYGRRIRDGRIEHRRLVPDEDPS